MIKGDCSVQLRCSPFCERIVMWIYFVIMAVVVVLDQISKHIILRILPEEGMMLDIIPGVFRLNHLKNDGAAFGWFDDSRWVFILLTSVTIIAVVYYLVTRRPKDPWVFVPFSMIVGGGVGNMIDRLFYYEEGSSFGNGLVIDFFDFYAFPKLWHWIFNVADSFVVVSAFILFGYLLVGILKDEKKKKGDVAVTEATEEVTEDVTEHTAEPSEEAQQDNEG